MTLSGKWRITSMALWERSFLDMLEPAYILLDGSDGGEFAFGCVTGQLHCRNTSAGVSFTWQGASGDGWVNSEPDGSPSSRSMGIISIIESSTLRTSLPLTPPSMSACLTGSLSARSSRIA